MLIRRLPGKESPAGRGAFSSLTICGKLLLRGLTPLGENSLRRARLVRRGRVFHIGQPTDAAADTEQLKPPLKLPMQNLYVRVSPAGRIRSLEAFVSVSTSAWKY